MTTESDIWRLSASLDAVAKAIDKHDSTPTPTRKQWVREAAVRLACVNATKSSLHMLAEDSIKLADDIWAKTQSYQG